MTVQSVWKWNVWHSTATWCIQESRDLESLSWWELVGKGSCTLCFTWWVETERDKHESDRAVVLFRPTHEVRSTSPGRSATVPGIYESPRDAQLAFPPPLRQVMSRFRQKDVSVSQPVRSEPAHENRPIPPQNEAPDRKGLCWSPFSDPIDLRVTWFFKVTF